MKVCGGAETGDGGDTIVRVTYLVSPLVRRLVGTDCTSLQIHSPPAALHTQPPTYRRQADRLNVNI